MASCPLTIPPPYYSVSYFLPPSANFNIYCNWTPHYVSYGRDIDAMQLSLEYGTDIGCRTDISHSPLHLASDIGCHHRCIVQLVMDTLMPYISYSNTALSSTTRIKTARWRYTRHCLDLEGASSSRASRSHAPFLECGANVHAGTN